MGIRIKLQKCGSFSSFNRVLKVPCGQDDGDEAYGRFGELRDSRCGVFGPFRPVLLTVIYSFKTGEFSLHLLGIFRFCRFHVNNTISK